MNMRSSTLSAIFLLGAFLFQSALGGIVTENGRNYNEDDCRKSARRNSGSCAVIFEKKECDLPDFGIGFGSEKAISEGRYTKLRMTGFNNDVESIIVKPGCVLFGYDKSDKSNRGKGISVSAVGKSDWVYKELDSPTFELEDEIEAVECYCGSKAVQATEIKPLARNSFLDTLLGGRIGTAVNHCNMWIHSFNRLPKSDRACAVLFEGDDCETGLTNWYKEAKPSNRVVNLPRFSTGPKANSAESVLVRPGCTFTGYDKNNGGGKKVQVTVSRRDTRPKFHELRGMDEDINSYKCTC